MDYIEKARWVLQREIEGIEAVSNVLGASFLELVDRCKKSLANIDNHKVEQR